MSKKSPADILNAQRIEMENQLRDLESRRQRLSEVIRKTLPAWDETQSARAIAQAELQDRLHGTDTAAAVAAREAEKRQAYGKAKSEQIDAQTALDSVDVHVEVFREELQRVTRELDDIAQAKAEKEFTAARTKLLDMAQQLRDQVIIVGAWGMLADRDPRPTPIRIPAFDAENLPSGWWDSGRHYAEFGKLELSFAIENKAMELREAA